MKNMFDTTIHKTRVCPVTRVVEKTITPDKVAEMYDSTKEQIDRETVNRILFNSDILTGVVSQSIDYMTRTTEVKTAFRLNGKLFERKYLMTKESALLLNTDELLAKLLDHYKDEVSKILMKTSFSSTDIFNKKTY